jgi:translation elongation factor EF-Ts
MEGPTIAAGSPGYAICIWCGGNKGAAWLRCPRCERLPTAGAKLVMSRACSQRYSTVERLSELSEAARRGEPIDTRTSMVPPPPLLGPDPDAVRVPGTVLVAKCARSPSAVLVELRTATDDLCDRREFLELAARIALLLGTAEDADPAQALEHPEIVADRAALETRYGERIEIARHETLKLPQGTWLGTFELAHVPPESIREGRARLRGNLAVAAAAIATEPPLAKRTEIVDFANQLAEHTAMVAPEDHRAVLGQPFLLDPDVSVREACAIVERAVGARVEIVGLARLERATI